MGFAYRWHPSREHRRRQAEIREMNQTLGRGETALPGQPPILYYASHADETPVKAGGREEKGVRVLRRWRPAGARDLSDFEEAARPRRAWLLEPKVPETDQEYFRPYRRLLTRAHRRFLLQSPYARAAAITGLACVAFFSALWMTETQKAEALASGRLRQEQKVFEGQLRGAAAFGVDSHALQPLEERAWELETRQPPSGLIAARLRIGFYDEQTGEYRRLEQRLQIGRRQAWQYWSWKETQAYATLARAVQEGRDAGLREKLADIPPCTTAACYQQAVGSEEGETSWIRATVADEKRYQATIQASTDPISAAATRLEAARNLQASFPAFNSLPVRLEVLDGMYATAASVGDYARIGALGQIDATAIRDAVVRKHAGRIITVSTEEQELTAYQAGQAVYRASISSGLQVPTGVFHIGEKEPALGATYWYRVGRLWENRYGILPDWMSFSGQAALQAAPWRTVFGPGAQGAVGGYAPSTPYSIDVPVPAAHYLYGWSPVGAEVVIY